MRNGGHGFIWGISLVIAAAVLVRFAHPFLPLSLRHSVSDPAAGMAVGMVLGNFIPLSDSFHAGARFAFNRFLKLAIILLGLRISFAQFVDVGSTAVVLVIGCMIVALAVAHVMGAFAGVPRKLCTLIGVGTAVCGNTAIAAVAPAIRAEEREMSFAIATNTVFGTAAVFLYPIIGRMLGLEDSAFGFWAGSAINDTSQVVAAGFSLGEAAGAVAVTTKLIRNALMGFVIVGATLAYGTRKESDSFWTRMKLPGFVTAFLAVAVANSLGVFGWVSAHAYGDLFAHAAWLTRFLIVAALVAVGVNTRFRSLKSVGIAPFFVGICTAAIVSLFSLGAIKLFSM